MAGEIGPVNFAGLSSGLDTKSIVNALVSAARGPMRQIQQKQAVFNDHRSTLSDIKTRLESLSSKGEEFDTQKEFLVYKATSSDDDKVTVAAGGNAYPGSYSMSISALAEAQRTYSTRADVTDEAAALGFGDGESFTITDGTGATKTINVDSTTTLNNVASLINGSGAEVTAGVIFDGTNYYLQISSNKTGAANGFSLDEAGIASADKRLAITNTQQAAADASVSLDGFTITSADNIIDDVVPGVTLNLNETTTSAVTLRVDTDQDAIIANIEALVSSYNNVMGRVNEELVFNGVVDKDRMQGDGTLRGLQQALFSTVGNSVSGLSGEYTALSTIGITTGSSGMLEIDKDELKEALNTDVTAVADLFITNTDSGTEGVAKLIQDTTKTYTDFVDGYLTTRIKGLDTSLSNLEDDIVRLERNVSAYENNLNAQFTQLEITMVKLQQQNSQVYAMLQAMSGK